ncbi:nickel ABC transporter substrate-binding protein [Enterococcus sp. AZ163]|uniref:nickel ABC transporter substrate-binding protein n=1 Tax=Enterococcus sp. AZ163 TaxID=2774638 RepID=UPI003D2B9CAB
MKRKRLNTIFLGLVCLLLVLSSCGEKVNQNHKAGKLIYGSTKDIRDINPHLYNGEMSAQNMVFEGLTKNEDGKIKPALAESWTISEDGKEYTFKLRSGVQFSDGEPFNAEAVKQNFDAILANKERHAWLDMVNEIDTTQIVDDHTFKLSLKHPYYPTLTELGLTRPFRFISPKSFKDSGTKDGVISYAGTGPYKLVEHKDNQSAVFEVNDSYWGAKPKITEVDWKVISDSQSLLLALKKGELDLIYGADGDQLNTDAFNALSKDNSLVSVSSQPVASRAILLNSKRENLQSLQVREAITHAINKKNIINGILNGSEEEAESLLPKTAPYSNVELKHIDYDVEQAKKLLDEAGWKEGDDGIRYLNGKPLKLIFSYNAQNAQEGTVAESIQADLKEVGIDLSIVSEEKQDFLDRQKDGDFDLQYSLSWGTPYDPQSYVSSWRIPAHGDYQAQTGLEKKAWLDNLISEVMVEPDETKRQADYSEILTYVNDQCVYVPISYSKTKAIGTSQLKNVVFNDSQYEIPFEKMYFEEE